MTSKAPRNQPSVQSPMISWNVFLSVIISAIIMAIIFGYNTDSTSRKASFISSSHFILLGATGDLSTRYLLPALISLRKENFLMTIYATSRKEATFLQEQLENELQENRDFWKSLIFRRLKTEEDFASLCEEIPVNSRIVIYLSIPPTGYLAAVEKVARYCLEKHGESTVKIVLEKPFGVDSASASQLFQSLSQFFDEGNIYLVDHYKAKEAVIAIPQFFQHNTALLQQATIRRVEVTLNESSDVDSRIDFYEQTGVIRDVVQNHVMEILIDVINICFHTASVPREDLVSHFSVDRLSVDQYPTYQDNVQKFMANSSYLSRTPTFVQASLTAASLPCSDDLVVVLTAGKALKQKISIAKIVFHTGDRNAEREVIFHIGGHDLAYPAILFRGFPPDAVQCPVTGSYAGEVVYDLDDSASAPLYHVCRLGSVFGNAYENVIRDVCDNKAQFSTTFQFVLKSWKLWEAWLQ